MTRSRLTTGFVALVLVFSSISVMLPTAVARGSHSSGDVYVHGYTRHDGTYVQPHYRSHPDGDPYNNWSFPGNTNPYTGKTATGDPDTYLRNYDQGYGSYGTDGGNTSSSSSHGPGALEHPDLACNPTMHEFDHGCVCNLGFSGNGCAFSSCPSGYKLNKEGTNCVVSDKALDPSSFVRCIVRHPCSCPAGYVPFGNRTCIPQ